MKRSPTIVVQLVHLAGPRKREIQEFAQNVVRIGKYSSCEVRFPPEDPGVVTVSRAHAEIVRDGNQFKLIDHSTNGTFVNGKRVTETYLRNGDILEFSQGGPKVSFLTEMREAPGDPEGIASPPLQSEAEEGLADRPRGSHPPKSPQDPIPSGAGAEPPPAVAADVVKADLTIQYGPTIRSYKELPISIGKSPKCQFVLDHPAIYDQHAQISYSRNHYWVKDLTGQHLVKRNGQAISSQASLSIDDELALSPKGPFFKYVGKGRFAEALPPPDEEPPGDAPEGGETGNSKVQPSKRVVPKIKKLFTT